MTGGKDSLVKVWDPRLKDVPVVTIAPNANSYKPDCWTVSAGDSHSPEARTIAAGFDNGDVKIIDLRTCSVLWEANIGNGVCSVEFDRRDIKMNKLVATTLESKFHVWDLRTLHPINKFAKVSTSAHKSTVWCVRHLPQNRDVWMTTGGNGSLCLWKYKYPARRTKATPKGDQGVSGTLQHLQEMTVSSQPVTCFDWSVDRQGLAAMTSIDQCLRVIIVTRLNTL